MKILFPENRSLPAILCNMLTVAVSLFVNGFGIYLTIRADLGSAPWDVLNLGLSSTFGILYGTASILVSLTVLGLDLLLREQIGIAMLIDAVVVGKSVDLFNFLDLVPVPEALWQKILMIVAGLFIIGYTQYFYMRSSLGCGPRDTLLVGIARHAKGKIPIGVASILIMGAVTLAGYFLGGPVGIGTLLCAFGSGPVMQFAFFTVRFDAAGIRHQNIVASFRVIFGKKDRKEPEKEPK